MTTTAPGRRVRSSPRCARPPNCSAASVASTHGVRGYGPTPTRPGSPATRSPKNGSQHGAVRGPDRRAAPGPAAWQADPEADPLTTFEHLIPGPVLASARLLHPDVVEPSLAGPLADLLDAVADAAADSPPGVTIGEGSDLVARSPHAGQRELSGLAWLLDAVGAWTDSDMQTSHAGTCQAATC
jgi:hypothetical protein